jgi:two-component sensor histidine kinase
MIANFHVAPGSGAPDPFGVSWLMLRWVERGGPPMRTPTRRGFGSRLIERSLSAESGTATID